MWEGSGPCVGWHNGPSAPGVPVRPWRTTMPARKAASTPLGGSEMRTGQRKMPRAGRRKAALYLPEYSFLALRAALLGGGETIKSGVLGAAGRSRTASQSRYVRNSYE